MDNFLPKITVWILNYNGLQRLKVILPSILNQTYNNLQILIVDNGSTDGSIEYIKNLWKVDLIENWINLWYWKWKNILVEQSKWEYIFMIDEDIQITKNDFISYIFEEYIALEKDNIAFLSVLVKDVDKSYLNSVWLYFNKLQKKVQFEDVNNNWLKKVPWYHGNEVFFKREIFLKLWKFDEIYPFNIDDYDLSARAYLMWYTIYIDTNSYVIHHWVQVRINPMSLWWRYEYYFAWYSRMIWKNYTWYNIFKYWFISILWIFVKTIIKSLKTKSLLPLKGTLISIWNFVKDFQDTLASRRILQNNRIIKDDIFLKLK